MDENNSRPDEGTTSRSNDDDSALEVLPQGDMLGSELGRNKVAVMRRNVSGRRKPTRQGLRDSLLKSMDESELQSILADVSIDEEQDESASSAAAATTAVQSPPAASRTNSFRSPLMDSLNNDLTNVLRRRQSRKSIPQEADSGGRQDVTAVSNVESTAATSAVAQEEREDKLELPPLDMSNKPKITQPEDIVATPGACTDDTTTHMETSPVHEPAPVQPYIKPQLRPISMDRRPSKDSEQQPAPWIPKLNKVERGAPKNIQPSNGSEPSKVPWSPKLRKVEIATEHVTTLNDTPPVLPPKPKLRPVLASQNVGSEQGDNSSLVVQQQSVSIASLPSKTLQSPTSAHLRFAQTQHCEREEKTSVSDANQNHWEHSLKHVTESPKMRRSQATTNSQPDWIRQAAEKRKRASVLLEQAEALANLSKGEGDVASSPVSDHNVDPFVQLRHPNRTSRSSSIESNSTTSSQHSEASVPPWKRELNHQSSLRRIDRRKKTQSAIEPTMSSFDAGKENRDDNSIPAWRKQLKGFSRGSVIEMKEETQGGGPEPEFIKMFKKRQERLRKCGSQLVEAE